MDAPNVSLLEFIGSFRLGQVIVGGKMVDHSLEALHPDRVCRAGVGMYPQVLVQGV